MKILFTLWESLKSHPRRRLKQTARTYLFTYVLIYLLTDLFTDLLTYVFTYTIHGTE